MLLYNSWKTGLPRRMYNLVCTLLHVGQHSHLNFVLASNRTEQETRAKLILTENLKIHKVRSKLPFMGHIMSLMLL